MSQNLPTKLSMVIISPLSYPVEWPMPHNILNYDDQNFGASDQSRYCYIYINDILI
jgi:hypothetical protein